MVNYQNFCSLPVTRQATRKGNLQDLNKLHQSLMTIRSCTSNSKTSAGDESKNATSSSQASNQATKLPEIKSMPNGLTDLVTKTSEAGWPSLQNISLLALRCDAAGVTIEQVEDFFCRNFRKKEKKDDLSKKRPNHFYSKVVYDRWEGGKRDKSLAGFLDYFKNNLVNDTTRVGMPIKRAEYVMAVWRLGLILEKCHSEGLAGDLARIEECGIELLERDPILAIMAGLARLSQEELVGGMAEGVAPHLAKAVPHLVKVKEKVVPHLVKEVTQVREVATSAASLPSLLLHTQIARVVDRLAALPDVSAHAAVRLQLIKARGTWSQGVYSVSLDALSAATTSFICLAIPSLESDPEQTEDFLTSCLPFVSTWHQLATAAMQHKLGPALDYLMAIAEVSGRREGGGLGSLPTYALLLAAKEQGDWEIFEQLEPRLPAKLRSEKFERIFSVKSMTEETKNFFAREHVKRLLTEKVVVANAEPVQNSLEDDDSDSREAPDEAYNPVMEPSTATEEQSQCEENQSARVENVQQDDPRSEAINVQLLEIGILELVAVGKVPEVVEIIQDSAAFGRLPTSDAIQATVGLLESLSDIKSLGQLYRALPPSPQRSLVFESKSKLQLNKVSELWGAGKRLEAWVRLVELYKASSEAAVQGEISQQAGSTVLASCLLYCRAYIESSVLSMDDPQILKAMRSGAEAVAGAQRDPSLLVILWEAFFFAPTFQEQQEAGQLQSELPWLLNCVQVEQVISRCRKYEKELFFRNLLEASLRQLPDSENEEGALAATILKSRSFEELLAYQVRGYNLKGAQETLATAQSLGVQLSADYHELYIDLEKEVAADFGKKPIKATLNWLKQAFTPLEKEGGK